MSNAKTKIQNKLFVLFDDTDHMKLFSNRGEYEKHGLYNQSGKIMLIDEKKSLIANSAHLLSNEEDQLSEDEFSEQLRVHRQLRIYGSRSPKQNDDDDD